MNITSKVKSNIDNGNYTYDSMSTYLGISKPTLYTRLSKENWKKGEIVLALKLKQNEKRKVNQTY